MTKRRNRKKGRKAGRAAEAAARARARAGDHVPRELIPYSYTQRRNVVYSVAKGKSRGGRARKSVWAILAGLPETNRRRH